MRSPRSLLITACGVRLVSTLHVRANDPEVPTLGPLLDERYGCQAEREHTGVEDNDHMATTMASGDWNGDGIADLLVASARNNIGPCEEGEPCPGFGPGSNTPSSPRGRPTARATSRTSGSPSPRPGT